jgi:small subunit ribosomal protein S13
MARIAGVNIPNHKHAEIALLSIYGIGRTRSRMICKESGVSPSVKMKDLTDADVDKLA